LQEINIEKGFFNFFTKKVPQRIYIHGDVGRGKTFLMDMLFEEINHEKKKVKLLTECFKNEKKIISGEAIVLVNSKKIFKNYESL